MADIFEPYATAQNNDPLHDIDCQYALVVNDLAVHVIPSGEVTANVLPGVDVYP